MGFKCFLEELLIDYIQKVETSLKSNESENGKSDNNIKLNNKENNKAKKKKCC